MRKRTRKLLTVLAGIAAAAFIFASCATTIPIEVRRPPTLDTIGIERIAIMPFESASNGGLYGEMARYATSTAASKIQEMNHFTLVNAGEIERLRKNNENIENYVDALFSGQITRVSSGQDIRRSQYKRRDGSIATTTYYITTVEMEFNYSFTRARDGSLIGPVSKRGSKSESSTSGYPSASGLCTAIVNEELRYLHRDIIPHTVTQHRTMASEKSNNKALKTLMKDTLAQVKEGSYNTALDSYIDIYERYKSVAAAENASILYEAQGNTTAALTLMQKVAQETGNPTARAKVSQLNSILQDAAAASLTSQRMSASESQAEKVTAYAGGEIRKVLPANAKVWIANSSGRDATVEAVVDNLTADFIRRGIGIVDRQNRSLIEAEQKLQLSGNVSDNDFVGIGNLAGANTIVTVGISGTGAMRRLSVRVLDIEKGVPIMQSDTSDNWRL